MRLADADRHLLAGLAAHADAAVELRVVADHRHAMLIGNGPDAMHRVTMVGNDMQLDRGIGMCGKAGQQVPVGVGQPHLRMNQMTVGGTRA